MSLSILTKTTAKSCKGTILGVTPDDTVLALDPVATEGNENLFVVDGTLNNANNNICSTHIMQAVRREESMVITDTGWLLEHYYRYLIVNGYEVQHIQLMRAGRQARPICTDWDPFGAFANRAGDRRADKLLGLSSKALAYNAFKLHFPNIKDADTKTYAWAIIHLQMLNLKYGHKNALSEPYMDYYDANTEGPNTEYIQKVFKTFDGQVENPPESWSEEEKSFAATAKMVKKALSSGSVYMAYKMAYDALEPMLMASESPHEMCRNEWDLNEQYSLIPKLTKKKSALFIVTKSDERGTSRPYYAVLLAQTIQRLIEELKAYGEKRKVSLLLHNFPAVTYIPEWQESLELLTDLGVQTIMTAKTLDEMAVYYGKRTNQIIDQCAALILHDPSVYLKGNTPLKDDHIHEWLDRAKSTMATGIHSGPSDWKSVGDINDGYAIVFPTNSDDLHILYPFDYTTHPDGEAVITMHETTKSAERMRYGLWDKQTGKGVAGAISVDQKVKDQPKDDLPIQEYRNSIRMRLMPIPLQDDSKKYTWQEPQRLRAKISVWTSTAFKPDGIKGEERIKKIFQNRGLTFQIRLLSKPKDSHRFDEDGIVWVSRVFDCKFDDPRLSMAFSKKNNVEQFIASRYFYGMLCSGAAQELSEKRFIIDPFADLNYLLELRIAPLGTNEFITCDRLPIIFYVDEQDKEKYNKDKEAHNKTGQTIFDFT